MKEEMSGIRLDTFRGRLKYFLQEEGIEKGEFAEAIGKSLDTVRHYLTSSSMPKMDMILSIHRAYPHWSLKYLLAKVEPPFLEKEPPPKKPSGTQPINQKETTLRMLAFREKLNFNLKNLPLDGFEITYQEALGEMKTYLDQCDQLIERLDIPNIIEGHL